MDDLPDPGWIQIKHPFAGPLLELKTKLNTEAIDIEKIVSLVTERLATMREQAEPQSPTIVVPHDSSTDKLASKSVIVADDIVDFCRQHQSANELRLAANAVVTPSARDEIHARGLQVSRRAATKPSSNTTKPKQVRPVGSYCVVALNDIAIDMQRLGVSNCSLIRRNQTKQLVNEAIAQVIRGNRVIAISSQPEWLACQLNRDERVFAAVICEINTCPRAPKNGFNCFVIDETFANKHLDKLLEQSHV